MSIRTVALLTLILTACASSRLPSGDDDDDVQPDASVDAPPVDEPPPSRVYAHSGNTLYRIDTTTLGAIPIGPFTNLGTASMTDLAVDRNERMVGVTLNKIFEIDPRTGASTFLANVTGPNLTSLSFVPANPAQPDGPEMLVAATDNGSVIRIEISGTTATTTVIGSYGQHNGQDIISSGDLVYVRDFGTVATVDVGNTADYLARIDPANGWRATVVGTGTEQDRIFGLAYWGGSLFGFADRGTGAGAFLEIDPQTGGARVLQSGNIRWFGAGVTTIAPVID